MQYDIIGSGTHEDYPEFFTIQNLINVCNKYPNHLFKFLETDLGVGELGSWRGSYDLPAITYQSEKKSGKQIAQELTVALGEKHYGYKGGEYSYQSSDEFYVSADGSASEFKVVQAVVEGDFVILYTKISPY